MSTQSTTVCLYGPTTTRKHDGKMQGEGAVGPNHKEPFTCPHNPPQCVSMGQRRHESTMARCRAKEPLDRIIKSPSDVHTIHHSVSLWANDDTKARWQDAGRRSRWTES